MVAEVAGVVLGSADGLIDGYLYDKKVDKLSDAIEKIMQSAHLKAQSLMSSGFSGLTVQQIDFFNHVNLSLQNVKNIYESEMNKTVEKVDHTAQAILASVDKMVHGWTRELSSPQIQQLVYQAKAIMNSLPYVSNRPILTDFSPYFVAPSNRHILIKCIGNFPSLPNSAIKPTLHFNDKVYSSLSNQPHIVFSVPLQDLFPLGGNTVHGIRSASFDVKIPHIDQSYWSYFWPSISWENYQGSIHLLPESPGKISVHYTKMVDEPEKETITSEEIVQNSRCKERGGVGYSVIDKPHTLHVKPGWKIIPETVRFEVISSKGDKEDVEALKNKWQLHLITPEHVTYLVTTHHYSPPYKHCGKIKFRISAEMFKTHLVPETTTEEYVLKWGESKVIDESKGSWIIHFDSFEGNHNEVPGYGVSKFFRVQSFGGKPVLSVDAPEQVTSHFLLPDNA